MPRRQHYLRGAHAGGALRFLVRLSWRPAGRHYRLVPFEVRPPTSYPEVVPYSPPHRPLTDPDFQFDVASFQLPVAAGTARAVEKQRWQQAGQACVLPFLNDTAAPLTAA